MCTTRWLELASIARTGAAPDSSRKSNAPRACKLARCSNFANNEEIINDREVGARTAPNFDSLPNPPLSEYPPSGEYLFRATRINRAIFASRRAPPAKIHSAPSSRDDSDLSRKFIRRLSDEPVIYPRANCQRFGYLFPNK